MKKCLQCSGELKTIYLVRDPKEDTGSYLNEKEYVKMKSKGLLSKKTIILENECMKCGKVFPESSYY